MIETARIRVRFISMLRAPVLARRSTERYCELVNFVVVHRIAYPYEQARIFKR